jgi:hypothetical protein
VYALQFRKHQGTKPYLLQALINPTHSLSAADQDINVTQMAKTGKAYQ